MTTDDDDIPTHDACGTDLRRVASLHERGLPAATIARILRIDSYRVRYAITVLTGDREGAPTLEEIAAECERIRETWTSEQARAARRGETRASSQIVADGRRGARVPISGEDLARRQREAAARRTERRLASGEVPVYVLDGQESEFRFEARVHIHERSAWRTFRTREEAVTWGREWLHAAHEEWRQSRDCCGR